MQSSRDSYSTLLGISEWKDYSGIFTSLYFLHYLDILQKTRNISLVRKKKKSHCPFWFLIQYGFKERMISKFNIFNPVSQYLSNMSIESHIIWAKKKKRTIATTEAKLLICHVPKGIIYTILSTQNEFWNTRSNFNFQREKKSDEIHPATSNYAKEGNNTLFLIQRKKITIFPLMNMMSFILPLCVKFLLMYFWYVTFYR